MKQFFKDLGKLALFFAITFTILTAFGYLVGAKKGKFIPTRLVEIDQ